MWSLLNDKCSMLIFHNGLNGVIEFLKDTYKDDGIRNKIIHHEKVYFNVDIIPALIESFSILLAYLNAISETDVKNSVSKVEFINISEK